MEKKQGITMVILVATVVIALIIMSVSILAIKNSIKNATLTTFKEELVSISQAVETYYLLNKEMPSFEQTSTSYSASDLENLTLSKDDFNNEISLNNEEENTVFYKIDLSKINVDKTVRGNKKNSDESDIYIVAYPSFNIYYLKGINVDNVYYFSYIKFSENMNKIEINQSTSQEITQGDLKVKKNVKVWTNKLNLEVTSYIGENNSIGFKYVNNSGEERVSVFNFNSDKKNTTNIINIDDLEDVGFSASQSQEFKALPQDKKKLIIYKLQGQDVVAQVEVDMSNYETKSPTYTVSNEISSKQDYNEVTLTVKDDVSKMSKVKYEYYKKVTAEGEEVYNADSNFYKKDNLVKNGKEAKIENDGKVTIKVPKEITAIKCVAIDKASNITDVIDIDTKTAYYTYYETKKGTKNSITFNIKMFKKSSELDNIAKITTKLSADGINYTDEINHGNSNVESFTYTDVENMGKYLYMIITLYTGSSNSYKIVEEKRIQIDTSAFIEEGTKNKEIASWDNPYIPSGFVHTEGNVENGFVISDVSETKNKYNEFVWVPVDYIYDNTTLSKGTQMYDEEEVKYSKLQNLRLDLESDEIIYNDSSSSEEYKAMIKSVKKYGGFYVARYEAGDVDATSYRVSNSNEENTVEFRKNLYPYNFITLEKAISQSRDMYSTDVKSHLIYGCQWDAIMHWVNLKKGDINNSTTFGNYFGNLNTTGKEESYVTNNIYDLAGNVAEMTMEVDENSNLIVRGGSFNKNDEKIDSKISISIDGLKDETISFRTVLYII